jgi:hypothetical protein
MSRRAKYEVPAGIRVAKQRFVAYHNQLLDRKWTHWHHRND